MATTLRPCIKPPSGILDIFKELGPYFRIICFRRRRTTLTPLPIVMKRLVYTELLWWEIKELKDTYPRVKEVSQTSERLLGVLT